MSPSRRSVARGDAVHRSFRSVPGSDYIASGFAIGGMIDLIERRRPRALLEIGPGVGATTAGIAQAIDGLSDPCLHAAVEDVPFCLEQLAANLGDRLGPVVVVGEIDDLDAATPPFDVAVVDGGAIPDLMPDERDRRSPDDERQQMGQVVERLAPGGVVLVENDRHAQRSMLADEARARGRTFVHEHVRPFDGSPGYHLHWFEPGPVRRAGVAVRSLGRSMWFPRGVRARRRIQLRVTGSPAVQRDTVARGGDPEP